MEIRYVCFIRYGWALILSSLVANWAYSGAAIGFISHPQLGPRSSADAHTATVLPRTENDPPSFTKGPDQSIAEDAGPQTVSSWATQISPGPPDERAQTVFFIVTNANPALFAIQPALNPAGTLSYTPAPDANGSALVTLKLRDNGGTARGGVDTSLPQTFTITVTPVNDAPTISPISDQSANEDAATALIPFVIGDVDTPQSSLLVAATSSNPDLVPDQSISLSGIGPNRTVLLLPPLNQSGATTIKLTVDDGSGATASQSFVFTVNPVNDPPTITSIPDQITDEDVPTTPVLFLLGSAESPVSSLTVTASSTNPALIPESNILFGGNGADRSIQLTPATNQSGTATIKVTVDDGHGGTATQSFVFTVNAVNDPPAISAIPEQSIDEDTGSAVIPFTIGEVDTSQSSLVVSATSSNLALVPNENILLGGSGVDRTIQVTPAANQSGTTTITITADDGSGGTATQSFVFTVNPVNDSPAISTITDQSGNEDTATAVILFTISEVDTLQSSLSVSATSSNLGLVPNENILLGGSGLDRTIQVTPAANQSGTATITITVNDGNGGTATQSFLFTVTPVNDPPTISAITDQSIDEDTLTTVIPFTIGDVEQPHATLSVSATSSNPALVPDQNIILGGSGLNRTIQVAPATNQFGTATITVTVDDGGGAKKTQSFEFTVHPISDPPTISSIADQSINSHLPTASVFFTVGGVETPPGSLILTASSSNSSLVDSNGMVFGGSGAERNVTITPLAHQLGSSTITITVLDDFGSAATVSFVVTVEPVNGPPTISNIADQSTLQGAPQVAIPFTIGDAQTPVANLTLKAGSSNPALVHIDSILFSGTGANRTVSITPGPNQVGSSIIAITVTDTDGDTATETFLLTVNPVENPPTISDIGDELTNQDTPTGPIPFTVADVDTPTISLILSGSSSDQSLVPDENIFFGGSGPDRFITITPAANRFGSTTVTIIVRDGPLMASRSFVLTVIPTNDPLVIVGLSDQIISANAVLPPTEFTVAVTETDPSDLVFTVSSSNPTLVPDANILVGGSGTNRTISLKPTPNEIGRAVITIDVLSASSGRQASQKFGLTVLGVPPVIVRPPQNQVTSIGSTITLTVEAEGLGPFSYQWRKNGATLPGATGPSLTLENIQPANAGTYSVAVENDYGAVSSEPAIVELSVGTLPMTNNFADRVTLNEIAGLGSSSNAGASKEAGEQNHAGQIGGKSMWISWTAASSGIASFSTEGSSFDTLLAVYTGNSLGGLTEVAKDDDSAGFYTSAVRFNAFAGTVYNIAVDGLARAEGRILLSWNLNITSQVLPRILTQPQNQIVEFGTNVEFSVLAQGPALSYQWYFNWVLIPGANENILNRNNVQLSNVGSYFVRVSNEGRFVDSDVVSLEVNSIDGVTVKTVVSGDKLADVATSSGGALALQDLTRRRIVRKSSPALARGFTGTQLFSSVGSAKEQDEPNHCGITGGASQWFAYQAPKNGVVSVNTDGSNFDTVLAVYTGNAGDWAGLQNVACDNNSGLDGRDSAVTFPAVADTVYYIAVDGVDGATGSVRLNYKLTFPIELQSTVLRSGLVGFGLICLPGQRITIQSSTDLLNWASLLTTNTPSGFLEFSDVEAPTFQRRFYRAQSAE